MTIAFPPLIPQDGSHDNHEYNHTPNRASNNNGWRCALDSSRSCTSPLCYLCGLDSSRVCISPLCCWYYLHSSRGCVGPLCCQCALDSSRVAGGRKISKCPIAGDWGSSSISLELLKGLRCCWALRDLSIVRIGGRGGNART